jgi:hypothetical protein
MLLEKANRAAHDITYYPHNNTQKHRSLYYECANPNTFKSISFQQVLIILFLFYIFEVEHFQKEISKYDLDHRKYMKIEILK